ncbi:MAG: alpha/beta hydrolase [Bacteroidetes bacterium]|nr:MAG: alpha/beta hydrolase [Bacteroidota bacterium]
MKEERIIIHLPVSNQSIGALLVVPANMMAMMVLGHGAGAGMEHRFMSQLAENLADQNIGTLRYNFPYIEQGRRSPGSPAISEATVRATVEKVQSIAPHEVLLVGGKSYGGRMSSQAQSKEPLPGVSGLVFFGFPLHAPGKPGDGRGTHLKDIEVPMLFLQGSRDKLADLDLLKPLLESLDHHSTLQVIEGADHGFNMLKSADKTTAEVQLELAELTARWLAKISDL